MNAGGAWLLVDAQAFVQGDFLILEPDGGLLFACVGDECRVITDQYSPLIITESENWSVLLQKDCEYENVDIWRAH